MISFAEALYSLIPTAEWSMEADDYENIIWHKECLNPPTRQEIVDEQARLQAIEDAKPSLIELHQSALNKLIALGLTEEEALALVNK